MPRALTVARVSVAPEMEEGYLATVRELAALIERRGQHLWVFRSSRAPHTYLEFSEAPSAAAHRLHASRSAEELELESRLRALATYAPESWDLWEEIPFAASGSSGP
jgi:hypothetical protein